MARTNTESRLDHWSVSMLVILTVVAICRVSEGAAVLTDYQKMTIVNAHNFFRIQDVRLHNASNVRRMQWDDDLANLASEWVDHCKKEHSPWQMRRNRGGLVDAEAGENIWYGGYGNTHNLTRLVAAWYGEKRFYDYENGCMRGRECGHYTQVVRSDTYKVGCGLNTNRQCGNFALFSCNYAPSLFCSMLTEDYLKDFLYYLGIPCDECFGDFLNYCIDGLCSVTGEADWTTTTTPATTTTTKPTTRRTTRRPLILSDNEEPHGVELLPWNLVNSEEHLEAAGNDSTTSTTSADTILDATTSETTEFLDDTPNEAINTTTVEP